MGVGWIVRYLRTALAGNEWGIPAPNVARVEAGRLYRSSAPSRDALERASDVLGIATVIDLRERRDSDLARDCAALGIVYVPIPCSDTEGIPHARFDSFLFYARAPVRWPILVHCQGGRHRTGVMCMAYRVIVCGWTYEEAFNEAVHYGWYEERGHAPLLESLQSYLSLAETRPRRASS